MQQLKNQNHSSPLNDCDFCSVERTELTSRTGLLKFAASIKRARLLLGRHQRSSWSKSRAAVVQKRLKNDVANKGGKMINQNTAAAHRIAPDLTLYLHNGSILIRAETLRAREHLEQHQSEYEKWLYKFYFADV